MSESVSGSGINRTWSYSYDENGNLTGITDGNTSNSYAYDALNQLTTANHNGKSYSYTYDKGGNILSKTVEGETVEYSYTDTAWGDLLTAYNGESITYDTIGNPLTYRGMTFTWSGRELSGASANGKSYTYKYNADGLRTQKSVDGTTTYYIYSGDKLVAQKTGNNTSYLEYDSTGSPFLISYNGSHYYYILNGQGDVIALIDNTGNTVVEYTYDPWGQITSITGALAGTLGQANPMRYREYYYDSETGLYYLQSRYYDPETGRFISADGLLSTGQGILGHNMFAYCLNNPTNRFDIGGNISFAMGALLVFGVLLIGAVAYRSSKNPKGIIKIIKNIIDTSAMLINQIKNGFEYKKDIVTYSEDINNTYVHLKKGTQNDYVPDSIPNAFVNRFDSVNEYQEYLKFRVNQPLTQEYIDLANPQHIEWSCLSMNQRKEIFGTMIIWDESAYRQLMIEYTREAAENLTEDLYLP